MKSERVLLSLCLAVSSPAAVAQMQWTRVGLDERTSHATATDPIRGRVVLFGGSAGDWVAGDTHEWDGTAWTPKRPVHRPPARRSPTLAYDAARARIVLFGGLGYRTVGGVAQGYSLNDTWEWDGTDWVERQQGVSPLPREQHAMAYDAARGQVVLFGGYYYGYLADTWVWNGTTWARLQPARSPSARGGHAMAYDAARGRVVLVGGRTDNGLSGETWLWDGSNWNLASTSGPTARETEVSFDPVRQRIVLFGGVDSTGWLSDTWEWDGSSWTPRPVPAQPPNRDAHALAYDPIRRTTLLFGGLRNSPDGWSDVWAWDGTAWIQLVSATSPPTRDNHALAWDSVRQQVILFGGLSSVIPGGAYGDTWAWDGDRWHDVTPAGSPTPRGRHMMASDPIRRRLVLFGGGAPGRAFNDTWEWDGTAWSQSFPMQSPPAASATDQAMVWDGARRRVFLFNGGNWYWDGVNWTMVPSATVPSSRRDHALAFDAFRGEIVLFGGVIGSTGLSDETWTWDGTNWTQHTSPNRPPRRSSASLTFNPVLGRVVLFGGTSGTPPPRQHSDVWDWDGTTWTERTPTLSPPGRENQVMAYDEARQCLILFGGWSSWWMGDTWELRPVDPGSVATFGQGCAGSRGVPVLTALQPRPWLGDPFTLVLGPVAASRFAVLWSGHSRTRFGSFALPFDLTSIGAPGCALLASGQIVTPIPFSGGLHQVTFGLPLDPTLAGASFYQQALVLDPTANPAGLAVSQGLAGRFGQR